MVRTAAIVSFRLGAQDGVSVQAATWAHALGTLGFTVRRVAGELADGPRPGDVVVPGLAVGAEGAVGPTGQLAPGAEPPGTGEVEAALAGAQLIVVENVLSLPLNLPAAEVLTDVLERRLTGGDTRVVLHHHDFAWQRDNCAHLPESLPPKLPGAVPQLGGGRHLGCALGWPAVRSAAAPGWARGRSVWRPAIGPRPG